jgi:hypothetical protein
VHTTRYAGKYLHAKPGALMTGGRLNSGQKLTAVAFTLFSTDNKGRRTP